MEKKKPFWKRTNRGFWVSMVILAAVLLYVLVTQLMLIPQRAEIRELAQQVKQLSEETTLLTDEQAQELAASPEKQQEMMQQARGELEKYFVEDSDYLDTAVDTLYEYVSAEFDGSRRTKVRDFDRTTQEKINILEDTATANFSFKYLVDGEFTDYSDGLEAQLNDKENVGQYLYLSLVCRRVDGDWKIYRMDLWDSTEL